MGLLLPCQRHSTRGQSLAQVMRVSKIENSVAQNNLRFFMQPSKGAGQRVITELDHDSRPCPLPELPLGRPELGLIATNYQRVALSLSLLLVALFLCHLLILHSS